MIGIIVAIIIIAAATVVAWQAYPQPNNEQNSNPTLVPSPTSSSFPTPQPTVKQTTKPKSSITKSTNAPISTLNPLQCQ